mmetsp:Transcript_6186/g.15654  ORF Transcript_6186/g.15654 Transcript_6186/m.15654 type:complete len:88 (+) Transcript_6186:461-724(+)
MRPPRPVTPISSGLKRLFPTDSRQQNTSERKRREREAAAAILTPGFELLEPLIAHSHATVSQQPCPNAPKTCPTDAGIAPPGSCLRT